MRRGVFERYLEITWDYGVEHVPLVAGSSQEQYDEPFITQEFWPDEPKQVFYQPEIEHSISSENTVFLLHYRREQHPKLANLDVEWGTSLIEFAGGQKIPKVSWRKEGKKRFVGGATVKVHNSDANWSRKMENVSRIQRSQDPLRQALLSLYGSCAISGEQTACALEAAHVVDVKNKGSDYLSNALLLRADLHALFDRDMFKVSVDDGRIYDINPELSRMYHELLRDKAIPRKVLGRVRDALRIRISLSPASRKSDPVELGG